MDKATCMFINVAISVKRNGIKKEAKKILKYRPYNRSTAHVERNKQSNTGNCNHLKIIQTVPEQHTWTALHQGTTDNSHTVHCTHIAESAGVQMQHIEHGK